MGDKILLNSKEIEVIINRLCCQLIENHMDFKQTVLIGIQPRGTFLAQKMVQTLSKKYGISDINFGVLDITFFRDDFRRSEKPLVANTTDINFIVENKQVVFIDDVLYTGRSIRAALTAIQSFGRPSKIELLVFIDRRFSRHLPIQPDYTGWKVDAINEERVVVHWAENDKEDAVYLIHKK
jgi:bifunctional protein pyrR